MDDIKEYIRGINAEKSALQKEIQAKSDECRELNEMLAHAKKKDEDNNSIDVKEAFVKTIEYLSKIYNEVLDRSEDDILGNNVEIYVNDLQDELRKTGIILNYHKRNSGLDERIVSSEPKSTGDKELEGRVAYSNFGFETTVYIEGFSKKEQLKIYTYDPHKDPHASKINIRIHDSDGIVKIDEIYSGCNYVLPSYECSEGIKFKGWSSTIDGPIITDSTISPSSDVDLYPQIEPEYMVLRIRFKSEVNINLPQDIAHEVQVGKKYHYEFVAIDGCVPNPNIVEGVMRDSVNYDVEYVPAESCFSFDDHFKVVANGEAITNSQCFDHSSVEVFINDSNYAYKIIDFVNLRGADLNISFIGGSTNAVEEFSINVEPKRLHQEKSEVRYYNDIFEIGSISMALTKRAESPGFVIKLIDQKESNGIVHLHYMKEIREYEITWNVLRKQTYVQNVRYGEMPEPPECDKLIYNRESKNVLSFLGWDKDIAKVESDRTYNAQYGNSVHDEEYIIKRLCEDGLSASQLASELKEEHVVKKIIAHLESAGRIVGEKKGSRKLWHQP